MGAKHNLPSLENTMIDSPNGEQFYGVVGVVVVVGKQFLIVLMIPVQMPWTH